MVISIEEKANPGTPTNRIAATKVVMRSLKNSLVIFTHAIAPIKSERAAGTRMANSDSPKIVVEARMSTAIPGPFE